MFTLVLNNGEEFKLTLWSGQSFDLQVENLLSRSHLEPLPCTLILDTGTVVGYVHVNGESEKTTWELMSETLVGRLVKWGDGTAALELRTSSGALYGYACGFGSAAMELDSSLLGSGRAVIADPSHWQCLYELATVPSGLTIDKRGVAHSELEFATDIGALYGSVYGHGAETWELATSSDSAGGATIADPSQWDHTYELLSTAASSSVVVPLYVGVDIDKTVSALGDITIAEYCWEEVIE